MSHEQSGKISAPSERQAPEVWSQIQEMRDFFKSELVKESDSTNDGDVSITITVKKAKRS
eukprot:1215495-Amphidinium_carterae.1